jgi:hypothetical protein
VALRFCRSASQLVAGRQVFRHPGLQGRHDLLDKRLAFHRDHGTAAPLLLRDVLAALAQVPPQEHPAEAKPRHEDRDKIRAGGRRGPQLLGDILPSVLARLGVGAFPATASGEDLHELAWACAPRTPSAPKGQTRRKAWRSLGSATPATAVWGRSPEVPVGRDGDRHQRERWLIGLIRYPLTP